MADNSFKDHLANIRQRILQKRESAGNLDEIPTLGEREQNRREGLRQFTAGVRELEKDKRIIGAVSAHFDIVTKDEENKMEEAFPKTAFAIFKTSEKILKGAYGNLAWEKGQSLSPDLLTWEALLALLILYVCKNEGWRGKECPEIFNSLVNTSAFFETAALMHGVEEGEFGNILFQEENSPFGKYRLWREKIKSLFPLVQLLSREEKILLRLFRRYLDNLANPSSVGVEMMLRKGDPVDKTLHAAMQLKNKAERSRSINHIVENLIGKNHVDEALQIVRKITKKNQAKPLASLLAHALNPKKRNIDELMTGEQIEAAIKMAETIEDESERDRLYQRLASMLAGHNKLEHALQAASKISDRDIKNFALSSMACALSGNESFGEAIRIASLITEPDFQEDAYSYIVKGLLEKSSFSDVVAFVEQIENPIQKTRAAKLILSSVRSTQDTQKVKEVCSRFHLVSR